MISKKAVGYTLTACDVGEGAHDLQPPSQHPEQSLDDVGGTHLPAMLDGALKEHEEVVNVFCKAFDSSGDSLPPGPLPFPEDPHGDFHRRGKVDLPSLVDAFFKVFPGAFVGHVAKLVSPA